MSVDSEKLTMMMSEASGPINFTVFLEMLANKLHGTDPEDVIVDAFKLFDPENTGKIPKVSINTHVIQHITWFNLKDYIGDLLCAQADRFTKEELDGMISAAPVDENLMVDYRGLAYIITHGVPEDDEDEDGEEEGESEDSEQTEE